MSLTAVNLRRFYTTIRKNNCSEYAFFARGLTQKIFNERNVQLWSDGGKSVSIKSTVDNIGGWQTDDSLLLDSVDISNVKYQSVKGKKHSNQDRIQITELLPNILFVGVFDGHGGSFVVDFVSKNLHVYIKKILEQGRFSLTGALRRAFIDCDSSLAVEIEKENNNQLLRHGSTTTVALLRNGQELVIANVGDSRAILSSGGKAILLTNDHTPSSRDEKNRILACGGSVDYDSEMTPRVNGRLAMSRCFGNFDLKMYGVIPVPEIRRLIIDQDTDEFLALVTDGVSSVITTDEATKILNSCTDPEESVEMLTSSAIQFGSEDDTTAILLPFRSFWKKADVAQHVSYGQRNIFSKKF